MGQGPVAVAVEVTPGKKSIPAVIQESESPELDEQLDVRVKSRKESRVMVCLLSSVYTTWCLPAAPLCQACCNKAPQSEWLKQ